MIEKLKNRQQKRKSSQKFFSEIQALKSIKVKNHFEFNASF
jgi:hypothetical protein